MNETKSRTASDGLQLHYRCWEPEHPARAEVFFIHGYNEHIGRYEHVAAIIRRTKRPHSILGSVHA